MKAKYKFSISGEVKLDPKQMLPIYEKGYCYSFLLDERSVATHIEVTIPVEEKYYPNIVKTSQNRHELNINNPALHFIQRNLRGIEALMSVWGLQSIDKRNFEVVWLPESADEKEKLKLFNFSTRSERMSLDEIPPLSFDLVARAVITSWDGAKESVITSFYRKGTIDMEAQEYIDAIYDFYMILETRFGDGKWRGNQVKQKLKSSAELKQAFTHAKEHSLEGLLNVELRKQKQSIDVYDSYEKFIDYIVDLRGTLHHHSEKNPKAWDPSKPEKYELDAVYLHAICNHIIFKVTRDYIDDESVKLDYERQCNDFLSKYA
ncbi:hypothetical protein [Thalassotalea agariperforans]